jgi:hypothetical protein
LLTIYMGFKDGTWLIGRKENIRWLDRLTGNAVDQIGHLTMKESCQRLVMQRIPPSDGSITESESTRCKKLPVISPNCIQLKGMKQITHENILFRVKLSAQLVTDTLPLFFASLVMIRPNQNICFFQKIASRGGQIGRRGFPRFERREPIRQFTNRNN